MYGAQLYFVAVGWGCGFGFKTLWERHKVHGNINEVKIICHFFVLKVLGAGYCFSSLIHLMERSF